MKQKPLPLTIRPVLNGWIVEVGCQTIVFNELRRMASDIVDYYRDPEGVTKAYLSNRLNVTHQELLRSAYDNGAKCSEPCPPPINSEQEYLNRVEQSLSALQERPPKTSPS